MGNYQTIALTIMILGRYILCHSFVDWQRYIEVPGAIFVYSSAICHGNIRFGLLCTSLIYAGALAWHVRKMEGRPSKWDPSHPEIQTILSKYEARFTSSEFPKGLLPGIEESNSKSIVGFQKDLKDK